MPSINKVGLFSTQSGRVLLCRKRHTTSALILPGGKIHPGENPLECLERELREELGADAAVHSLTSLGCYEYRAAHDDPSVRKKVRIDLYAGTLEGTPSPCSEIRELVWFSATDDWSQLAPSLSECIFPDLRVRGLLPW